jgi:hypothetical protein
MFDSGKGVWSVFEWPIKDVQFQPENPVRFVLVRRSHGARVRLFTDVYGNHGAVLSTGWFRRRRVRVALTYAEVCALKNRFRRKPARARRQEQRGSTHGNMASGAA